ncbi:PREDICTED: cytosolic Fe-S cluster assembly factor NUBP2-like [Rhagoletis zephyria]|uniref:cytosolic Fe-S cluster assembly factor NUBP2-like n=1 Tax=Rhagoletis zephyria TaxID=28612 RepID=UPI0008117B04|nr:PREDICTED: cytosolic Fe-S cluster assembly factor NUBP2-like [Rhagoletis zephyria]
MGIEHVKHVILILSGKGGVGKSTVSCELAVSLQELGHKVGLLDIDICGPSVPRMFGLTTEGVEQGQDGWIPVKYQRPGRPDLAVMSIGFLLRSPDTAVIWRGPKKHAMIRQFLGDVNWGQLDYLLVDTPPGTSDEHISVVEGLQEHRNPDGAILVTTPQAIAIGDVRREITFCRKGNIDIVGLVENMSGYVCEHCSECTNIFSSGGGEKLARHANIDLLTSIPIEPRLGECLDHGLNFIEQYREAGDRGSETCRRLMELAEKVVGKFAEKDGGQQKTAAEAAKVE